MFRHTMLAAVLGTMFLIVAPTADAQLAPVVRKICGEVAEKGARKGGKEALEGAGEKATSKTIREGVDESAETATRKGTRSVTSEGAEEIAEKGAGKTVGRTGGSKATSRWKDFTLVAGGAAGAGYIAGSSGPSGGPGHSGSTDLEGKGPVYEVLVSWGVADWLAAMMEAVLVPAIIGILSILAVITLWSPCVALCRRTGRWLSRKVGGTPKPSSA